MKKFLFVFLLTVSSFVTSSFADAGNYSLRFLAGPSFNISDWEDQFRFGGEFNYDLGYDLKVDLISLIGVGDNFRFQLIPGFGYNYLYLGPAIFHILAGAGYADYNTNSAIDVRLSTGLTLPLGDHWEAYSDINYFVAAAGTAGTPQTFDWLLGFGYIFK